MIPTEALSRFESELEQHVLWILDAARRSPPGGGEPWTRVLSHYGVAPDPPCQRLNDVRQSGQSSGATLSEVRRVGERMLNLARQRLEQITPTMPSAPGEVPRRAEQLRIRLSILNDEILQRHSQAVCPVRAVASSVGQIFANAQTTTAAAPWAQAVHDPSRVLECPHCGGPQEIALVFVCRYCNRSMAHSAT